MAITDLYAVVTKEVKIKPSTVEKVIQLIEEGNTVPFIARYRKEITGGLDEVQIKKVVDTWEYAVNLQERKEEVIRLIEAQDQLTDELKKEILTATKLQQVEDLYRPYRQKRRTRATIAKEKGLEPLAELVYKNQQVNATEEAVQYFNEEHELHTIEDVLAGVNDIIAEWISDHPKYREHIRQETFHRGQLQTNLKNAENDPKRIYEMYYDYVEAVQSIPNHRILAINRGEKEDVLRISIEPPQEYIEKFLQKQTIKDIVVDSCRKLLEEAISDSYKRLIQPSIEREIRNQLTERAEAQAIKVFSENLKKLLLQPPLKGRIVLGVDPAFRTGCKLAAVDATGKMLAIDVIYPHAPKYDIDGAKKTLLNFLKAYPIELIAIGNGTASRETEQFVANVIKTERLDIPYLIVDEAGASVYSASALAREEFPDLEVEERSAVSIARRVQDPLAELVKIDPKSIGVGQYQHDVSQRALNDSLSFVVEMTVNQVGVNVNTASTALLEHVSGLSKRVARNIVEKREELGRFNNREQLKDVPQLGPKTYEQAIGFLRILDGDHPLDRTSIHPESYGHTEQLLKLLNCDFSHIGSDLLKEKVKGLSVEEVAETLGIGELTLIDILQSLTQPERDPRDDLPQPILQKDILQVEDLKPGMKMQGTVRNVVDFGAFVDIGVGQDGLVHISKLAKQYVKHPLDVISVGDIVTVWIEDVDVKRERISLTMVSE